MTTRIGLISDVHATPAPVAEALSLFGLQGIEQVFCLGDIAGYGEALEPTVALLEESGCLSILGNHDQWFLEDHADSPLADFFQALPTSRQLTIEGVSVYMVHASPPDSCIDGIRLLDQQGEKILVQQLAWAGELEGFQHDVLIVGHTHQVFAEPMANTLVINPGSTVFNHSCAILSLPDCSVEWLALSGEEIQRSWNWSGGMPGTP
ncbi:metallophosphoesterase family protein [Sulfuriflexus mobilis]|uniref:metallophosphoesterase family protein n=1 Tax=Sulfuriflexus mobilis TaxID=1811807 RepID=UPI000F8344B4|nr:metallophosphoesterase family protein [Sulfuriflexus mobilis]